jgi:hypothetical protein
MALFEMLYGRRCQTPLFWKKIGKQKVLDTRYSKKPRDKSVG